MRAPDYSAAAVVHQVSFHAGEAELLPLFKSRLAARLADRQRHSCLLQPEFQRQFLGVRVCLWRPLNAEVTLAEQVLVIDLALGVLHQSGEGRTELPERKVLRLKPLERVDNFAGGDVGECRAEDIRETRQCVCLSLVVAVLEYEGEDGMFDMLVSVSHGFGLLERVITPILSCVV